LAGLAAAAAAAPAKTDLSAEQIVAKYVAARGGLEAWHKVQTMAWSGHIQSGNAGAAGTTFIMKFKRPDMTRFEISAPNQKAVHVFDGVHGWKLRQTRSGSPGVEDYTPEELSFARDALGMDGPLMDYRTKGVVVTLAGSEKIDGNKAYRLNLTLPSGAARRTWIDAHTFLEVRYDREVIAPTAQSSTVSVYYRNYQPFEGLQIPLTIETGAGTGPVSDKMIIDRVAINPPLAEQLFYKPRLKPNAATLGTQSPPGVHAPPQPSH